MGHTSFSFSPHVMSNWAILIDTQCQEHYKFPRQLVHICLLHVVHNNCLGQKKNLLWYISWDISENRAILLAHVSFTRHTVFTLIKVVKHKAMKKSIIIESLIICIEHYVSVYLMTKWSHRRDDVSGENVPEDEQLGSNDQKNTEYDNTPVIDNLLLAKGGGGVGRGGGVSVCSDEKNKYEEDINNLYKQLDDKVRPGSSFTSSLSVPCWTSLVLMLAKLVLTILSTGWRDQPTQPARWETKGANVGPRRGLSLQLSSECCWLWSKTVETCSLCSHICPAAGIYTARLREDPRGAVPAADREWAGQGGGEGGAAGIRGAGCQLWPEESGSGGAGPGQPAANGRATTEDGGSTEHVLFQRDHYWNYIYNYSKCYSTFIID